MKNEALNKLWIQNVKRKNFIPTDASSICSVHFRDSDYLHRPGRIFKALKPDAVPSVFSEFPEYYQPKEKKQRSSVSDKLEKARIETNALSVCSKVTSNCDSQKTLRDSSAPTKQPANGQLCESEIDELTSQNTIDYTPNSLGSNPSANISTETCIQSSETTIPVEEIVLQLKEKVSQLEKKNDFLERRIKVLLQKIRRRDKTISNLQDLLKDLKSQGLIDRETSSVLTSHFGGVSGIIVVEEEESD